MKKRVIKVEYYCILILFIIWNVSFSQVNGTFNVPNSAGIGGSYNTNLGTSAGSNSTDSQNYSNVNVGMNCGKSNFSGKENTSVGFSAFKNNTSGSGNVAYGSESLFKNTIGNYNIAIGRKSLYENTSGINNISIGSGALGLNTIGNSNQAIGQWALLSNISGESNSAMGTSAGRDNISGNFNLFLGIGAGIQSISGNRNTFIGAYSGKNVTTGSNNVFIGSCSLSASLSNSLTAGSDISNSVIISDGSDNQRLFINSIGYAGIGLANNAIPQNRLHIGSGIFGTSGLRFTSLTSATTALTNTATPINNKFLTVNENGDVILQNLPAGLSGTVSIANGINTTVTGTGVSPTPYVINAKNIYTDNGSLTGTRTVTMGNNNLIFSSNSSTSGNGRVYIGDTALFPAITATSNYRLLVEGGILTEKVKVALRNPATNWADYVFADDYKLKPLKEVEAFINENNHLPGISSVSELVKEGLDLADMQAKQMAKIEELTLYAIEQNKQIEKQNREIEKQNKDIEELKEQVKLLLEKSK